MEGIKEENTIISSEVSEQNHRRRITDLFVTKLYTRYERDEFGVRQKVLKAIRHKRAVERLSSGRKLVQIIIDVLLVQLALIGIAFALINIVPEVIVIFLICNAICCYRFLMEHFFQRTLGMFLTGSILVDEYGEKPRREVLFRRATMIFVLGGSVPVDSNAGNLDWLDCRSGTFVLLNEELNTIQELMVNPNNFDPELN
jgi:hypothetical protein